MSGAILHEMPLLSVLDDPSSVASAIGSVIGPAMEAGGARAALDAFLRFAFGDAIVDGWPAVFRDRMLANAEMAFSIEMPAFQAYRPDTERLTDCRVPVTLLVGEEEQLPFFLEGASWLADRLGTQVGSAPDAHGPQFSAPTQLAATIRAIEAAASR